MSAPVSPTAAGTGLTGGVDPERYLDRIGVPAAGGPPALDALATLQARPPRRRALREPRRVPPPRRQHRRRRVVRQGRRCPARRVVLRAQRLVRLAARAARLRASTRCRARCGAPTAGARRSITRRSSSTSTASGGWSTSASATAACPRSAWRTRSTDALPRPRALRGRRRRLRDQRAPTRRDVGRAAPRNVHAAGARRLRTAQPVPADRARTGVDGEALRHPRPRCDAVPASRCAATSCAHATATASSSTAPWPARSGRPCWRSTSTSSTSPTTPPDPLCPSRSARSGRSRRTEASF